MEQIAGTVVRGPGSKADFQEPEMQAVWGTVGWYPYPGTLNIRPAALPCQAKELLGPPDLVTPLGGYWLGRLAVPNGRRVMALMLLRENPAGEVVELVTALNLRISETLKDGDTVTFLPHGR